MSREKIAMIQALGRWMALTAVMLGGLLYFSNGTYVIAGWVFATVVRTLNEDSRTRPATQTGRVMGELIAVTAFFLLCRFNSAEMTTEQWKVPIWQVSAGLWVMAVAVGVFARLKQPRPFY